MLFSTSERDLHAESSLLGEKGRVLCMNLYVMSWEWKVLTNAPNLDNKESSDIITLTQYPLTSFSLILQSH